MADLEYQWAKAFVEFLGVKSWSQWREETELFMSTEGHITSLLNRVLFFFTFSTSKQIVFGITQIARMAFTDALSPINWLHKEKHNIHWKRTHWTKLAKGVRLRHQKKFISKFKGPFGHAIWIWNLKFWFEICVCLWHLNRTPKFNLNSDFKSQIHLKGRILFPSCDFNCS